MENQLNHNYYVIFVKQMINTIKREKYTLLSMTM